MSTKLIRVPATVVPTFWDSVKPLLLASEDAWAKGHTLESLFELLLRNELQLWILFDEFDEVQLAGFTEFRIFPRGKALFCVWLAGKGFDEHAATVIQRIEDYAWLSDASYAVIEGRPAFQRIFASQGYTHLSTSVYKELSKGRVN